MKTIEAIFFCPNCSRGDTNLVISVKNESVRTECGECGVVDKHFVDYHEDLVIGSAAALARIEGK